MAIKRDEVAHVATLARLTLSEAQIEKLTTQMNDILGYMDKLNELDTKGIEPTSHALKHSAPMRDDVVRPSLNPEEALANAPQSDGHSFVVPRVI